MTTPVTFFIEGDHLKAAEWAAFITLLLMGGDAPYDGDPWEDVSAVQVGESKQEVQ